MIKKVIIITTLITFWTISIAFAYVVGGSNLGYVGYPEFDAYLPYNPSRYDIEIYINDAQEYIDNCNNDIQRILEAQQNAINTANDAIYRYNNGY